jgi:hypothetical protein
MAQQLDSLTYSSASECILKLVQEMVIDAQVAILGRSIPNGRALPLGEAFYNSTTLSDSDVSRAFMGQCVDRRDSAMSRRPSSESDESSLKKFIKNNKIPSGIKSASRVLNLRVAIATPKESLGRVRFTRITAPQFVKAQLHRGEQHEPTTYNGNFLE